jgi:hypothetical protein
MVEIIVTAMLEHFDGGDWSGARKIWDEWIRTINDPEEALEVWRYFDSKQRAYLNQADRKYLKDPNYD